MHSAQRAGAPDLIYTKWTEDKGKTDQELADLIEEILNAEAYDESWQSRLGARRTLWELFGLLKIEKYPIINGSAERGLEFFGYETPEDYNGAVEQFEAFKEEYRKEVGHVTAGTDYEVSLNYEIDQLLNVIDKVSSGDPETEPYDAAATLYQRVLEANAKEEPDGPGEIVPDPTERRPPKAWQVAPDKSKKLWSEWSEHDTMSIGWDGAGDFGGLSKQEIATALGTETSSNDVTTLNYFANSIIPGDVTIARHGRSDIDGIGVVTSEYYHDPEKAERLFDGQYEDYQNFIDVDWHIDFVDELGEPISRPESLDMFAVPTVCVYKYYEELKNELVDEIPGLEETFTEIESRQSELSTEYWSRGLTTDEYADIEEATADILQRIDAHQGADNWLLDAIVEPTIQTWTKALRRNRLDREEIDPDDQETLDQIHKLYRENRERLATHAEKIGSGRMPPLDEAETLFVVLIRNLQDRAGVGGVNFNHVKMERLLGEEFTQEESNPLPTISDKPDRAEVIQRQLEQAQQLVFHGPPGTGKTYSAQRFSRWWLHQRTESPRKTQLEVVTFHPSFTYEDFIEGLTAKEHDGSVTYDVEDGVFKRIAERARQAYEKDRSDPRQYVLIIDEINRGNLAQIFGETITLLEADKRIDARNETTITLPHSGDPFEVPPNLSVIGTMNTADRSIALVDAALRRRFRFISFPPSSKVLHEEHDFSGAQAVKDTAEANYRPVRQLLALSILGLEELNENILSTPDLGKGKQIGHSYLLDIDEGDDIEERLRSITEAWQYEILPLLEEYYFGQFDQIDQELFSGSGSRLFDSDTKQIGNFSPKELADTLIALTAVDTIWTGSDGSDPATKATINYLLDNDLLSSGDELLFDRARVPEESTRTYDSQSSFWRCRVTGERGQQDNVQWLHNDEVYSLTGLAKAILKDISDFDNELSGSEYWVHPERDNQRLWDIREAHENGESDGMQTVSPERSE
jgi:5-methylcytosine-specific restriction protein B